MGNPAIVAVQARIQLPYHAASPLADSEKMKGFFRKLLSENEEFYTVIEAPGGRRGNLQAVGSNGSLQTGSGGSAQLLQTPAAILRALANGHQVYSGAGVFFYDEARQQLLFSPREQPGAKPIPVTLQ